MDKETETFILDLLKSHNILTLATIREDGYPQATTVGYVNDGLTIYIATFPEAQKVKNIGYCNKVSLTVDKDYNKWEKIKGLSMGGIAEVLTNQQEIIKVIDLLAQKFPQLADMAAPDPSSIAFLKITPEIVSVLNYEKGFGHTELVNLKSVANVAK